MTTLAEIFSDTQRLYRTNQNLISACDYSRSHHVFIASDERIDCNIHRFDSECKIIVSKNRTFEAAKKYAKKGEKVAVLNFADSYKPGGRVLTGGRAQEESLCRISTLYDSLSSSEMEQQFYAPHRMTGNHLANDDIIFTPRVLVFKSDTNNPELFTDDEWFYADVITCAAPCLSLEPIAIDEEELAKLHTSRANHILDVACKNEVDVLVLGAFGCGAFANPPEVIAKVYKSVVADYKHAFKMIDFAIYCADYETENYKVFNAILG